MKYLLIIMTLLLTVCFSGPIKPSQYLLRSDNPDSATSQMNASGIVLSHVTIATYLNQPGIILETSSGEINAAEQHLWAEPLRNSVGRFLANEITNAIGKDVYVGRSSLKPAEIDIKVTIDQLHGTHDGNVLLVAMWTIARADGENITQSNYKFSRLSALDADGYDALVVGEKKLLMQLAQEIGNTL